MCMHAFELGYLGILPGGFFFWISGIHARLKSKQSQQVEKLPVAIFSGPDIIWGYICVVSGFTPGKKTGAGMLRIMPSFWFVAPSGSFILDYA